MEGKTLILVPTEIEAQAIFPKAAWSDFLGYRSFMFERFFVVVSGAGKVNAALCACRVLCNMRVNEVVVLGVAGAYLQSGLNIGDVVMATKEIYADEKFEPKGFPMRVLDLPITKGRFLTLSKMPASLDEAGKLFQKFGAVAENMEGAAVAHALSLFGTLPVEIRSISNYAGDHDKSRWNIDLALENLRKFFMEFFM
ncbi:S-adenosylhomocysteine/5'-methylthioadenosine nucleosidase [Thermosulfidibacter takaii ABI70S6]|uniref:S-adenosylhomocysteine/5'-methylthioadenosine nucleosidase n=2 Tax=Thermosulfidibacter takaii TaxID=412593 RepID=A0A0S3QUW4_THET7|nr:S-adenosylhomocysteine/5'-methylthioadenosine nucleosidase [Thermosulfidibacter takaii ABI70S6]